MSDEPTFSHLQENQQKYAREVLYNPDPDDKSIISQPHHAKANILRTHTFWAAFKRFCFDQVRISNFFFLCISILDQTEARESGRFVTLLPLVLIVGVSAIIESIRCVKQKSIDNFINNKTDMTIFEFGKKRFSRGIKSQKELQVGDVLVFQRGAGKINKSQTMAPADLVIISTKCNDHTDGRTCGRSFLEPSNLTGELKKKIRLAPKKTEEKYTPHLLDFKGKISFDDPDDDLFHFNGELRIKQKGGKYGESIPLNDMNFVPRGTRITNAATVVAVVVYIGSDTKIGQNMKKEGTLKRSVSDDNIDAYVFRMIFVVLSISLFCGIFGFFSHNQTSENVYSNSLPPFLSKFPVFIWVIRFNGIIPISLLLSVEIIRIVLKYFIQQDKMFDQDSDSPPRIADTRLVDQLGCLTHIVFDKTGTCTKNELSVKLLACDSIITNLENDQEVLKSKLKNKDSNDWEDLDKLITMMAICNGITCKKEEDGHVYYSAESRDELALVESAASMGYTLTMKTLDEALIEKPDGSTSHFKILHTMPFTSDSRKMSIIVKSGDQKPVFLTKGAKDAVSELIEKKSGNVDLSTNDFSAKGYRSLFFASGDFSTKEADYLTTNTMSKDFITSIMADRMNSMYQNHVPKALHYIGTTGIQDDLRNDVVETIGNLKKAGIRLWMATGDSLEAAKFYANASGMMINNVGRLSVKSEPRFIAINKNNSNDTMIELNSIDSGITIDNLLMSGKSLQHILDDTEKSKLYFQDILRRTQCSIFAELKPSQKQKIVEIISDQPHGIRKILPRSRNRCIMAVGDGGNDLPMLEVSDIGIDINQTSENIENETSFKRLRSQSDARTINPKRKRAPKEDSLMNDARSVADFSVGDWKSLQRLILVHGNWNFHRIRRVVLYFFYKNVVFHLIPLWFSILSQSNGTNINSDFEGMTFNIIFASGMSLAMGIFEKMNSAKTLMDNPEQYRNQKFSITRNRSSFLWTCSGILHSFIIFTLSYSSFNGGAIMVSGHIGGVRVLGSISYVLIIVVVNLKMVLIENWNIGIGASPNIIPRFTISLVLWITAAVSILICFIKMLVASIDLPYFFFVTLSSTQNFVVSDLTRDVMISAYFPFYFLLTVVACFLPDYSFKVFRLINWEKKSSPVSLQPL